MEMSREHNKAQNDYWIAMSMVPQYLSFAAMTILPVFIDMVYDNIYNIGKIDYESKLWFQSANRI